MSHDEPWQVTDDAAVLYEQSFVPALFARSATMVVDRADIRRGDRVLDVGCGTGVVAREAASRVGPDGHVAGLDLNPRMLAVARRIAPDIAWREGAAGSLPFDDGSFDVVASQYALMFFPDPVAGLGEMWRVLAPGGRLAVAVLAPIEDAPGYASLADVAARVCPTEVVELLRSPFVLGDARQVAALGRDAGIDGAGLTTLTLPVRFPSIDALVHTEIKASPIRDVIDERSFDELLAGARAALAPMVANGGEVQFSMAAHLMLAHKP